MWILALKNFALKWIVGHPAILSHLLNMRFNPLLRRIVQQAHVSVICGYDPQASTHTSIFANMHIIA